MNLKYSKDVVTNSIMNTVMNQYFDCNLFYDNQYDDIKRYVRDAVYAAFYLIP